MPSKGARCPYRYIALDNENYEIALCSKKNWIDECNDCLLTREQIFSIIDVTTNKENDICLQKKHLIVQQ